MHNGKSAVHSRTCASISKYCAVRVSLVLVGTASPSRVSFVIHRHTTFRFFIVTAMWQHKQFFKRSGRIQIHQPHASEPAQFIAEWHGSFLHLLSLLASVPSSQPHEPGEVTGPTRLCCQFGLTGLCCQFAGRLLATCCQFSSVRRCSACFAYCDMDCLNVMNTSWVHVGRLKRSLLTYCRNTRPFWLRRSKSSKRSTKTQRTSRFGEELGIALLTPCTIVGQQDIGLKNAQQFCVNMKQAKKETHAKLEEALLTWFREVTAASINVDGKFRVKEVTKLCFLLELKICKLLVDGCSNLKRDMHFFIELFVFVLKARKWTSARREHRGQKTAKHYGFFRLASTICQGVKPNPSDTQTRILVNTFSVSNKIFTRKWQFFSLVGLKPHLNWKNK